jgi:DNA-binding response OmpR family regulator
LVEDDPFLIDIYTKKLKSSGFEVKVAENGEKALRCLQEKKPDLLLLDIVLPEMIGWEVLRKIKENPKLKDLKIVVLSNLGQKEEVEKGLKLGATKYLIKAHYTPSEVVQEIKKIL